MNLSFTGPGAHYFYGSTIWASQNELGKVIIGGSGYSNNPVFISYNHGQSFQNFSDGLPNTMVFEIDGTLTDQVLFAATELGPYAYVDGEDEWINIMGFSAPDQTYWSLEYVPEIHTARFGTYGRGIWDFIIDESVNIPGDINFDDIINITDNVLLVYLIVGLTDPTVEEGLAADFNSDGITNVFDIIQDVNLILGTSFSQSVDWLEENFPQLEVRERLNKLGYDYGYNNK